jgi:hypothetical protein
VNSINLFPSFGVSLGMCVIFITAYAELRKAVLEMSIVFFSSSIFGTVHRGKKTTKASFQQI